MSTVEKIALITGANRGIGLEIAKQLSEHSVHSIIAARNLSDAQEAAQHIQHAGGKASALKLDVTQETDVQNAAAFLETEFGHLDILINNAGVNLEESSLPTGQLLRQIYEINTIGPYLLIETLLPLLKKSSAGRIVNQSSRLGSLAIIGDPNMVSPDWVLPGYSSSKAALNMLTVVLARHVANTSIKINAAHPGWVKTRMGGEDAPLSPEDGAKTAVRLALLPEHGPSGKFFYLDQELPW